MDGIETVEIAQTPAGGIVGRTGTGRAYLASGLVELLSRATSWPGSPIDCSECASAVVPLRRGDGMWALPAHRDCPTGGAGIESVPSDEIVSALTRGS